MTVGLKRKRGTEGKGSEKKYLDEAEAKFRAVVGLDKDHEDGSVAEDDDGETGDEDIEESVEDNEEEEDEDEDPERGDGEEAWSGIGRNGYSDQTVNVDRDRSKGKVNNPPTGQELRVIRNAAELYGSQTFKLQMDALLPNVRPKKSRIPPLDRALLALHTFLMSLPPVAPQHPLKAARSLAQVGIAVPYSLPLPTEETNWKVAFEKPSEVLLVGSWANKVSVKAKDGGKFGVDIAVQMPDDLFQEKDYLNGRFVQKRAFYVAVIASAIQRNTDFDVDLFYQSIHADLRQTVLVLHPRSDGCDLDFTKLNAEIRIIPFLSPSAPIPMARLSPAQANIRLNSQSGASEADAYPPTPLYNASIVAAFAPRSNLLRMHDLIESSPASRDAVTVLRVWANQRGFSEGGRMCVSGFEGRGELWGALIDYLIIGPELTGLNVRESKRKPLGNSLSSYQLFRAAVDYMAKHDFANEPIFTKNSSSYQFSPAEQVAHYQSVFVGSSSPANLIAGIPLGSLDLLRHEASITTNLLKDTSTKEPFAEVFLRDKRDVLTRFDTVVRVNLTSAKYRDVTSNAVLDHGNMFDALVSSVGSYLRRGLGNRTKVVALLHPTSPLRPCSQADSSSPNNIMIGLIHDPENVYRLVDHGPAAGDSDQAATSEFREFWGNKAELRRFKDGRIMESVVWDAKTVDERAHIPVMIMKHILDRHFGVTEEAVDACQTSFDTIVRLPEAAAQRFQESGISAGFKAALSAFDNLVKSLKALEEELPLSVLSVSPASDQLRATSVFTPVAAPLSLLSSHPLIMQYIPSIDINVEFEKSGRWPDDLRAIQKVKLAFFERIASGLMASTNGLKAAIITGDSLHESEIQDVARLEIVTPEGWVFSARIWHDRELTLLDKGVDDEVPAILRLREPELDDIKKRQRQEAAVAKDLLIRQFIHGPRHHRAIASLSHRMPSYAGSVRLVKRWLASHWILCGHVRPEAVEIITAYIFVKYVNGASQDIPPGVPSSKERGFSSVVEFLKDWDWSEPLQVPLYDSEGPNEGPQIHNVASEVRSKRAVWCLPTAVDPGGEIWTASGPDLVVAQRVRQLAKATWVHLQRIEKSYLDVKSLFIHPTDDYDFIIELDRSLLPRHYQNVDPDPQLLIESKYVNLRSLATISTTGVRLNFDPAQSLYEDLQRCFKDTFKLFHDPFGGYRFGGVWEPSLKNPRPFRVLGRFSSMPINKNGAGKKEKPDVELNVAAVLNEITRMGDGLVSKIIVQNSR